jgi:hypothetical protein
MVFFFPLQRSLGAGLQRRIEELEAQVKRLEEEKTGLKQDNASLVSRSPLQNFTNCAIRIDRITSQGHVLVTTSTLGPVQKVAIPYILTSIKRPPPLKDLMLWSVT